MALPTPIKPTALAGTYDFSFYIQDGKGQGEYKNRYVWHHEGRSLPPTRVYLYYSSINIGNGYKKRLVRVDNKTGDVRVMARNFS